MENLRVCLNAVLPLLLTMLLGYSARRMGKLGEKEILRMNSTAFFFFMPCLLFNSVYTADLSTALNIKLMVFTAVGLVLVFVGGLIVTLKCFEGKDRQSVILMGIFRSNCALLGFPLIKSLVPGTDISTAAIIIVEVATINNIFAVLCMSIFSGTKHSVGDVLKDLVKNPLLIGSMVGIVFALFGWKLPGFVESVVSDLSDMSSPLLIILLGAFFKFDEIGKFKRQLSVVCAIRLLIIPAIILPAGWLLGFRGVEFAALMASFASPAAVTSFTMAQQMGGDSKLAGDIVVFTSVLSPFTLFVWCMAAKLIGAV